MNSTSSVALEPVLGLDVAKAKLDACLLVGAKPQHACFENTDAGLRALRAWLQKLGAPASLVVLEATGRYSELATATLHAAGHRVHVANPRRVKDFARSLGRRNKTDRIDAELIAGFGRSRPLPAWQPASAAQQRLRSLLRRLADLETMLQAERNRAGAETDPLLAKSLRRVQRALEKEIEKIEEQIAAHTQANAELHADLERLCAVEGIGLRTARWLCAEIPRHLPDARAAAAWLAVTPRRQQSGTSLHRTAPIGTEGNRHLRKAMFMAALVARQRNPRLKAFADRLAAAGKTKMAVVCAVLHKLIKIAFCLLKNQSVYDPNHHPLLTAKN